MAVTKEQLLEYTQLDTRAADLERQAKTFRDRQKQLERVFEDDLKATKKPSVIRHGYTFAWINGRANVSWAEEYLRECGPERANALKEAAGFIATSSKLVVLPPAPPPTPTPTKAAK